MLGDDASRTGPDLDIAPSELRVELFMQAALEEARRGASEGEVPVGAVLAMGDVILAVAHNRPIALNDATAHAELLAVREAGQLTGNYRLTGATLYTTLEPCVMCCGAIVNARLDRLVFGANDPKAGAVESLYRLLEDKRLNHTVHVSGGVLAPECTELLQEFFRSKRH